MTIQCKLNLEQRKQNEIVARQTFITYLLMQYNITSLSVELLKQAWIW